MRHNYFNLNQIKSNPDGQPTVNRQSRLMSYRGYLKNLAMIFAVLVMSIANIGMAWGADFTPQQIIDGASSGNVSVSSAIATEASDQKVCNTNVSTVSINGSANGNGDARYIQIQAAEGYTLSSLSINASINKTDGSTYKIGVVFFTGGYTTTVSDKTEVVIANKNATSGCGPYNISLPSGTRTVRIYRAIKINGDNQFDGNGTQYGSGQNTYVAGISATASSGGCSAPTSPSISGTTAYTEGQDISLTASATGTDGSTTYTWYKGADWATASAGSSIGSAATFTKASCAVGDAGTYWCNISNGTGCEVQVSKTITVAEASCDAADLTASNITSNGDQDAGTGITFSKEGSPASGDTWYWQTSATGTDKSSNASSPYTTATTVGSYTVYLRAYNTAGDCWGTAASMTNTIYPAPSAMIHNTFAVNDAWSSTIATQDKTNITSLNAMAAVGESVGSGSNKSGLTQKIPSQSSEDASKYMSLSFNVASGKQLNVTSVVFDEQPVSKTGTFKVSISDNQGSATKTQTIASGAAGSKHTLTLDGDIVGSFKGTVTVKVWAYGWGDGYRFGDYFYINGTVTAAAACTAPNHVDISGNYHFFPGETLALTATAYSTEGTSNPISAGDITGYQWQKYIGSDWENIVGETSATYTKANATTSNVGQYRCIVSTGATCSTTSGTFNVKCLQLYVYWDNNSDKCNLPLTKVDGSNATALVFLENGSYTYHFKITDGCGNWYGNDGTMTSSNCTNWDMDKNNYCGLTTSKAATYTFNVNYSNLALPRVSVVYPSTVQTGGYNLYFANDERNWSNIHYRIGRNNWNSKAAMTLVPGTANLYQTTTIHYKSDGGFEAWHIANNGGWSDGNSIYKTNTSDSYAITNATRFEGAPVPSTGLTVIPGSDHSTGGDAQNNNCEFYSYTTVPGMLTRNVSITEPSNGTLTVNYVDVSGAAQSFSSGNRDLAHTCIITVTAVPDAGYAEPATVSINGASHGNRDPYTITETTVVAATFSPQTYSITYKDQGNVAFSGEHIDTPSAHPTSHTYNTATNLNGATKTGYTFGGWYTSPDCSTGLVTSLGATAYTADITLYAKWTAVEYTITYEGLEGATHSNPTTYTIESETITFTNPEERTGYTFAGWNLTSIAQGSTGNKTVTATWTANEYSITYKESEGGTVISELSPTAYTYGTGVATLPTPTKAGYTFDGWYLDYCVTDEGKGMTDECKRTSIATTDFGNVTLLAKWTEDSGCKTWAGTPSSWTDNKMTIGSTLELESVSAAINASSNNEVWNGHTETVIALAGSGQYVQGHFTDGSNINTVTVSAANNQSAGNDYEYVIIFCANSSFSSGVTGQTHAAPSHADAQNDAKLVHEFTAPAGTKYFRIYRKVEAIGGYEGGGDGTTTRVYRIEVCPMVCSTPDAPTAFSNTAATSTTATFSITDDGDAASYEIYTSTSSSKPTSETGTSVNSKTPTITGLTASTTYYAWVRSVCDADHKSAWFALGTTSFTTSAAEPTALVTWQMKVDQAAWALKSGTTEDGTNITSIASTADEPGSTSTGITGTTGKVVMASGESNVDKAASFTFTVNSAKKVVPEKVTCKVLNVSSGNRTYKAQLSDNNGHVYYSTNTESVTTENVLTDATFNFASSLVLTGNVTLKVYAWKTSGSPTQFRMGEYVKLFGEVDDYSCTALNLTRGGQENGTYTVGNYTGNPLTCTVNAGEPASYQWKQYTLGQGVGEAVNAVGSGSTTTSFTPNPASANTYYYACEVTDICGNTLITPYTGTFVFNTAVTYSVTHTLTNVTATSGATGAGAATEGVAYNAEFAANTGYVLPSTITVTIDGSPATVGTGYTWNASTGAFQVPAAQVTGAIEITIAGETAPATKDIYYGAITITAGALTRGSTGTSQFFTNIGGTIANNTEISWSSGPGTGGIYYNSNNLTDAELSKSSNWGTSSGSNRYVRGLKFAKGTTYTLALGTKVASAITFYGWCGSESKTMTVGGEEYTSSATKDTFAKHEFIKSGGFTGNVSITENGDFYGILVITIQTATPCTTPDIPALSNQSLCEGSDIAAWDATQTAVLADGETVAYSWKKKGNDTELANTASFDLGASAAESQAGTYVVTVTVSKAGYASATATKEVTLTVNEATEVTSITADKATVYPTNSVTLTATANMDATWQWYTCTNAEGDGEAIISGAESASYTIASADAAGTYYYKAVATGGCGTGSMVYTLTVSAAAGGDCFHFVSVLPAGNITVSSNTSLVTPTHATTLEGGTMKVGSSEMTITKDYGLKLESSKYVTVTLESALEAGNVVIVKGTSGTKGYGVTINGVNFYDADNKTFDVSYTVLADDGLVGKTSLNVTKYSGSSYLQEIKITGCGTSCTDPEVTASADNTTACVGTSVTFTAANAHASATYQWQKYSGGAWTDITGATASTYNIASVVAGDALKYRVIAWHDCNRTSNEVTLSVPSVPDFGSTVPASVSVMQTIALSINTVEATDAVKYRWYKSADATWDAGDTEIGTNKELIKAYDSEAIGSPSYYIFCRAQNACGITTSTAIAVNVTAYVEEDCATRGNEGEAQFGFDDGECGKASYSETACWTTSTRAKYLTYTAPKGKYLKTAKVTVAVTSGAKCGYAYSTDGGTTWTYAELTSLSSTLTEKTIDLNSLSSTINAFRIGRNLQDGSSKDWGVTSGNFYLSKACFEYTNACTATTITPSTASVNYEMGDDWTDPTFTLSVAGTLSYSSSNEDIASVDDDGTVTFNGEAGTVTITASYAGGTISETEYCASSGSYTINVSCPGGAPKIVADGSTDMVGCNTSVTLLAKTQAGGDFADGTYQWFRNGTEIDGATSSSYTATQAGTYTVARTNGTGCTTPSTNSAVVTSETTEPEVERLVPFQYYHVNKTYSDQMKMRHLFAVKNSGTLDGKHFKMYVSRNGVVTDVTSSNALVVCPNADGHVDTVKVDLNKLSGKYSENDELVFTCKAIDCSSNVSDVYKNTITMNVIGATPTLALICSGSSKAGGTRKTGELTVGGDFLTGYNVADLCKQTGNQTFDPNTEWGFYEALQDSFIVTPVNGYAQFNKLNYEPFDILLLTDYPKSSKSEAAQKIIDDMAELCDYRPLLSFKTHFQSDKWKDKTTGEYKYTKWVKKGFTTAPVVPKQTATYVNIVCYAHPMFKGIDNTDDEYTFHDDDDPNQLVYQVLTGPGYEGDKGIQGFELADADNFVTIGLVHYNAQANKVTHDDHTHISWSAEANDRLLVAMAERQTNIEARMMLFSLNCGAQSLQTEGGRRVILQCLKYLLETDPLEVADCRMTFDNGAGNDDFDQNNYEGTGTRGDGLWSTAANWGPDYLVVPGRNNDVRIAAPCIVDGVKTKVSEGNEVQETIQYYPEVLSIHITENGSLTIPANSSLTARSTILRADENGNVYPTNVADISLGSNEGGNASLILNNERGDTKAGVAMYSTAKADTENYSAEASTWQYIGTPHSDVANAIYNYYDSWLYQYDTGTEGWVVIPNGGPLVPFRGYCVTHPESPHTYWMEGTLVSTTNQDISIPANRFVVVANSWTAPIQINELTDDDMEGLTDKSIYFFNTGRDPNQEGELNKENGRYAAGTYVSVPIRSAPYTGDSVIPSMQGFYVVGGNADGTLHLDYERHVRAKRENVPSGPMHAPARIADTDNEPQVAKFLFRGTRYDDRLIILERPDFTRGYDSGWDGEQWGGNAAAPMSYVVTETRWDAVSAIPEYEGTVIAFRAGEDSEYTIHFDYDGMEEALYLLDTETKIYTRVLKGNSYTFTCTDKAEHNRFILTRKAPQIATGVGNVSGDEVQGTKAKKLLIEDKMFIMVNGVLYDATGKVVK